ncbi:MAG: NAD(+) diphosphatase [Bacteroidales bacterium]|nr:NAD(+) diphosphatase [Bacteroidales bacterium]
MLHEIYPHRFDNQFLANRIMGENDFILHFLDHTVLLKTDGDDFVLPQKKDLPEITVSAKHTFLFTLDDVSCFLLWEDPKADASQFIYRDITFFRKTKRQEIAWAAVTGYHLMNWYTQNRFCGKCGAEMQHKPDERAMECPACRSVVFPRISPAIIVAVVSNNKVLLARGSNFPVGWYSLIAGYVDIGEPLEDTVIREVKEETGLDVRNIRYYKSQPWPLSGSIMIGFVAEADEDQPIIIDKKEIADAAWFTRGNLPDHSPLFGISGEMIEKFDKGEL